MVWAVSVALQPLQLQVCSCCLTVGARTGGGGGGGGGGALAAYQLCVFGAHFMSGYYGVRASDS